MPRLDYATGTRVCKDAWGHIVEGESISHHLSRCCPQHFRHVMHSCKHMFKRIVHLHLAFGSCRSNPSPCKAFDKSSTQRPCLIYIGKSSLCLILPCPTRQGQGIYVVAVAAFKVGLLICCFRQSRGRLHMQVRYNALDARRTN